MLSTRAAGRSLCSALLLTVLWGCESKEEPASDPATPPVKGHPTPENPQEFISAEGQAGQMSGRGGPDAGVSAPENSSAGTDDSAAARTVEEGDIYRALGPGKLLNLNPYRGLQVVDIADVSKPRVIGRLRESGQPVEMYVIGQRALVLLNNWTGYWGSRSDVRVEQRTGGLVLSVDLTNPAAPTVIDREFVAGSILTSRLTRQGERASLYVAAQDYNCDEMQAQQPGGCPRTVVQSLDVSTPELTPRTTLNLGGYVRALQATPEALIVARDIYEATGRSVHSAVSLVNIGNIDGEMVEGPQTPIEGQVRNKFNLDLRGGVLRVVSGSTWWGNASANTNHVETFDARDPQSLARLAHCTFGAGQQLFATLFMQDRAFFVTYLRQDPFHAFALGADGACQERSEFVVSGWNDFFKPAFADTRLIGIGTNDEQQQRTMSVSLYDVTNLDNPNPLLARKDVAAQTSGSAASWDDKAFSVLEGAVSVPALDDPSALETGLVLLPFESYGQTPDERRAGVQIYTFSERTLSRRGFMNHGQPVNRSFQPAAQLTANLSAESLSLFDSRDPNAPVKMGEVELAPSYGDVLDYGTFLVRVRDTRATYGRWWDANATPPPAYAEIIAKAGDPDAVEPIARIELPAGSRTFRVGSLLVVITTTSTYQPDPTNASRGVASHKSTLQIYDLLDPQNPVRVSSLESDRLLPAYGYGWGRSYANGLEMSCGVMDGAFYDDFSRTLPNALVLGRNVPQQESLGEFETCSRYYSGQPSCRYEASGTCEWSEGYSTCQRKVGTDLKVCDQTFVQCKRVDAETTCKPLAEPPAASGEHCYTGEHFRYWQSMELDVLDLRDPRAPVLAPVTFAREEESAGLVASGESVYYAFKRPYLVSGDDRPFAKYYFREVGLGDPAHPAVGEPVNVPGQLLAVAGPKLFTRDLRWGAEVAETWLHVSRRDATGATLEASQQFAGRDVTGAIMDGTTRVLVTHRDLARSYYYESPTSPRSLDQLAIYSAEGLVKLGETDVDSWSDMTQAVDGRVLFSVPSGMLIVNAQTPSAPYAQAYFPYQGWQRKISYDGQTLFVAGGPYGLYRMDATTHNLQPK
jgi:hypothetical protein